MSRALVLVALIWLLAACAANDIYKSNVAPADDGALEQVPSVEQIHAGALVLDAHADIELPEKPSRYAGADGVSKVAPSKMREGGVDAVVMSIAVGPMPRDEAGYAAARVQADKELAAVRALAADESNNVVIPLSAQALERAHSDGKLALILGLQNGLILGQDVARIDEFYEAGVRVFSLTHMGHNDFADSSRPLYIAETGKHEPTEEHGGLSPLGVAAIKRVNELGAVVDISQLSKAAALEVLALSTAPVLATHSNARGLTDTSRNLSDEELDVIGRIGGVVHVAPFRGYLYNSQDPQLDAGIRKARRIAGVTEEYVYPFELYWEMHDPQVQKTFLETVGGLLAPVDLQDMLNHVDYIVRRIGVDHVGIGTDFNHGSGIAGFDDASDAGNVTAGLLKRGYSEDDVRKIWGGNFLRVMHAAEQNAGGR